MKYGDPESSTLEFKRQVPQKDQIIKTAVGFSNLYGGRIIIGIDDTRRITGVDENTIDGMMETLNSSIYRSCTPPIFPRIYSRRLGDKVVLTIEIAEGMDKPYFITTDGMNKGTYIRMGNQTMKATPEIIRELQLQGNGKTFDETPAYGSNREDLDDSQIIHFLKSRKNGFKGELNDALLKSYKLLVDAQSRVLPTVGAVLLFARDPQQYFSESFIICTHFKGISGREAISTVDCSGNLYQQINEAMEFIISRLYKSFVIRGVRRSEVLEIPEAAVREIVINAVAHRNYMIKGPTKIAIYADRVEIFSPGLFPGPLDVSNLEQGITYLRNSVVMRVFRETGIVEKIGTGFITLFSSYRDRGLEKPSVTEGVNFVKCVLPRKMGYTDLLADEYTEGVRENSLIHEPWGVRPKEPSDDLEAILALFEETEVVTMALVLQKTGWARATAGRRLKKLMDTGKILKIGAGRYCHYRKALS